MEQKIIDDLILKLYELFPEIKAYDMKMDMQVEPPMFLINCYDRQRVDRITHGGFFYTYFFEIIFFPGHDEPELQIREIELELTDAVWRFGDGFRGDNIHANSVDGVLHLFFSVTVGLRKEHPKPPEIKQINSKVSKDGKQISSQTIKAKS